MGESTSTRCARLLLRDLASVQPPADVTSAPTVDERAIFRKIDQQAHWCVGPVTDFVFHTVMCLWDGCFAASATEVKALFHIKRPDARTLWMLGSCYYLGAHVRPDRRKALLLFERAARMRHAMSMCNVATMRDRGIATPDTAANPSTAPSGSVNGLYSTVAQMGVEPAAGVALNNMALSNLRAHKEVGVVENLQAALLHDLPAARNNLAVLVLRGEVPALSEKDAVGLLLQAHRDGGP